MNIVGKNIKNKRIELGLTQQELAKKLGYKSKSTINKIEKGINDISQSKLSDIAKALDTTPIKLMGKEERILSNNEKKLLDTYRKLNNQDKRKVSDYATYKLNQYTERQYKMVGYKWGEKEVSQKEIDELLKNSERVYSDDDL